MVFIRNGSLVQHGSICSFSVFLFFPAVNSCPVPVAPEKGTVTTILSGSQDIPNAYKSEIEFSCAEGYWLRGSSKRSCLACGEWSGSQPVCEPVVCDSPETPSNGDRASANLTFQSLVRYTCNDGFSLLGTANRECGANGQWTTPAPSCERKPLCACGTHNWY